MKYTKLITGLTALATTAMLFTGCSGSYTGFDNPIPIIIVENTNATTVPATEAVETTEHTEATEPIETTVPQTESNESNSYKMGDYVYVVYDGSSIRRGTVVAEVGEYVAVTHTVTDSVELEAMFMEFMELTDIFNFENLDRGVYPVDNCYRTSDEAWVAAGKEPME